MSINRRRFLMGAGGTALALPVLTKLHGGAAHASAEVVPKRIITVAYPMGLAMEHWRPAQAGAGFELPHITAPLEPFRDRLLLVSNIDNAVCSLNAEHEFGHPGKKEAALTGTLLTSAFQGDRSNRVENIISSGGGADTGSSANGPSVCAFVGERIRARQHTLASVDLGVKGDARSGADYANSTFFFEGADNPVSLQMNPGRAFNRIFAGIEPDGSVDPSTQVGLQRNKSVLDAVRASFNELRSGLGAEDRRRLDDHAARVRQVELDIQRVACGPPAGIPNDGTTSSPWDPFASMTMGDLAPLMNSIAAAAMGCDLAPVARIEFTEQQSPRFGVASVDNEVSAWEGSGGDWHAMVHGDPSPIDGVPTRPNGGGSHSPALLDGYRFFVSQFADLLQKLDETPEGPDGRSVLDNSLVMLASDLGDGFGHNSAKLGYAIAGNTGPGRLGYHYNAAPGGDFYSPSTYNVNHLLTSVVNMFCLSNQDGSPIEEFGVQGFARGTIPDLFG